MDDQKAKERMLLWFLDFIQADLKSLTEEERHVINVQVSHLYSRLVREPRERLRLPQKVAIPVFSQGDLIYAGDHSQRIQTAVKDLLDDLLKKGVASVDLPPVKKIVVVSDEGKYSIRYTRYRDTRKSGLIRLSKDKSLLLSRSESPEVPPEDIFTDYFFSYLLAGLPKDVIRKCEECQKLFAHLSAKRKIYCSSYCAWRDLSRKRREELKKHPREYKAFLKKERETKKRKYEEKRKAQLLLRKPPRPRTLTEKLVEEKMEMDAMDYYKP